MTPNLTPKQQRFADLVLGGMPASRAYREAGYAVTGDASAEACASRLLSSAKVDAYLNRLRAGAAAKAELRLVDVLRELAEFARDTEIDDAQRLGAYRLLTEHLARITPLAAPVAEVTNEISDVRVAVLALNALEAALAGRLPLAQALDLVQAAKEVADPVLASVLAQETRQEEAALRAERATRPASSGRTRPAWLAPHEVSSA